MAPDNNYPFARCQRYLNYFYDVRTFILPLLFIAFFMCFINLDAKVIYILLSNLNHVKDICHTHTNLFLYCLYSIYMDAFLHYPTDYGRRSCQESKPLPLPYQQLALIISTPQSVPPWSEWKVE